MSQQKWYRAIKEVARGIVSEATLEESKRILKVGMLGIPNAGKSELTNHLIGRKVTAVSSKKNTTTNCTLGAYVSKKTNQIVLYDLPGILRPGDVQYKGQMARIESAWTVAAECDVLTFIVDANQIIKKLLKGNGKRVNSQMLRAIPVFELAEAVEKKRHSISTGLILVLNKIDLISEDERPKLVKVEAILRERCNFDRCFMISALRGRGISLLKGYFDMLAKEGDWIFPDGEATDKTPGELAVELVREKFYKRLNKELPYRIEIQLLESDISKDGAFFFDIMVRVPNERVRGIVIGRRGCILEDYVKQKAKSELESAFKNKVFLNITVRNNR